MGDQIIFTEHAQWGNNRVVIIPGGSLEFTGTSSLATSVHSMFSERP